ncbi:PREDICTED: uncharacterized protein C19orf44 homolog [Elephantulus edwardii]|uniref:uncharacterized protein C19orf44 homolog n=1 Tax=Elephantulus edwardii TaxID=28737 RepID=UPI0003F097B3|nr:PREDICTED: uncharacterized protein C19orf44 homolog [Elephantulus edwardii]
MASVRKAGRSLHDLFGDFRDISLEDSKMEALRNLQASRGLSKITANQSRFLKRNQTVDDRCLFPKQSSVLRGALRPSPGQPLTTTSQTRASAALLKLAQIETKIRNRKAQRGLSDIESDPKTPDASDLGPTGRIAEVSSHDTDRTWQKYTHEAPATEGQAQSGQGSRFLKQKQPPAAQASLEARLGKEQDFPTPTPKEPARRFDSPDSDEEEMKELLGSLMESSREKETPTDRGLTRNRGSEKKQTEPLLSKSGQLPARPRALPLPSEDLPSPEPSLKPHPPATRPTSRTPPRIRSRTSSPQTPGSTGPVSRTSALSFPGSWSGSGHLKMVLSSPGSSEAEPSEASLSEANDDSLDDFKINVLSLDDLAPAISEKSDLEKEGPSVQQEKLLSPGSQGEELAGQGSPRRTLVWSMVASDETGPFPSESEVSECLNASSRPSLSWAPSVSTGALAGQEGLATTSWAYSDDFEPSLGPTTCVSTGSSQTSLSRTSETLSEPSLSRERDHPLRTPTTSRKWVQDVTRVIVKEIAVQTPDPAFTYQWVEAAGVATMTPALGGTYVDPTPIASHVVSADAIEALTAHSPAVFALNDLLRQQLALTQQFLEVNRHLHTSILASLDQDTFHYHSLEEAKEYIRCHKPAPLTLEAALEEVQNES